MYNNPVKRPLSLAIALAMGLLLDGCAGRTPQAAPLPEQIAGARTRADHEQLATRYEQAAAAAQQEAQVHREAKDRYERFPYSGLYSPHHVNTAAFAQRCQSAIVANEQAAQDDLALAKLHRDLATETKE
ncbi:MAG: hypothetical protein ISP90_00130 [Nevskia sp.]|nr:hypothetical protein [Nevskia sp.]